MSTRLPGLDLLRGLAALAVLWLHLTMAWALFADPAFPVFQAGRYGVQVFFAISGYVILMTALRSPSRAAFARSRVLRLYPAYIICMVLTTFWVHILGMSEVAVSPGDWLLNLTMIPGMLGARPVDPVYWTLGYEVVFYAVVWAALPLIKRGYGLHLAALALAVLPFRPMVAFFLIGVVLHEAPRNPVFAGAITVATAMLSGEPGIILMTLVLLIMAVNFPTPPRLSTWAGAVSYPLYLVHDFVGVTTLVVLAPLGAPLAFGLTAVLMVLLAAGIHRCGETPLRRALSASRLPTLIRWRIA